MKSTARKIQRLLGGLVVAALAVAGAGVMPALAQEPPSVLHVFLAAGQSNMSGRGLPAGTTDNPADPRIFQYGAKDRTFRTASVPLDMHDTATGISPATTFAREYLKAQPANVGVLIIPAAHGGTGFTSVPSTLTWTPGAASAPELDLSGLAVAQTLEGIAAAKAAGHQVDLKGVLWHQGENNAALSTSSYSARLDGVIAFFRSRLAAPQLPVVVGRMAPEGIAADPVRLNVDRSHHETPARVANTGFAPSTAGGVNPGDLIHFSRTGVDFLGKTYLSGYREAAAAVVDNGSLNAPVPSINGAAKVGSILTVVPGAWGPAPVALAYQWYRSGTAISGATDAAYTPVAGDMGGTITVTVTGSKTGYTTASQTSSGTAAIALGSLSAPVPKITGTASGAATVGSMLTAVAGAWGPAPVNLAYQWYRSGTAISGATSATYTPGAGDLGGTITVKVTGSKSAYTTVSQTSNGSVVHGALTAPVPTITGEAKVGSILTAAPGAWGPEPVTLAYQWYRSGTATIGATTATYKVRSGDAGQTVTVKVTGSKTGYTTASRTSTGTAAVAMGSLTASVPTITGSATVASTLTAVPGAWGPAPVTLAYQWYRSGTAISGATAATYTPVAGDLGGTITVKVTGSKAGYTTLSQSSSGKIIYGALTAPVPTITGEAKVGSTLTAVPGAWGPAPVTLAYQWYRSGTAISGATSATYTPGAGDLGGIFTVKVTGSKPGYTTNAQTSTGTAAIAVGSLIAPVPTITGEAKVGSILTAAPGAWGPEPVTLAYQWYRSGTSIIGATTATYKVRSGDAGQTVTVKVTGSKTGYTTASKTSTGTAAVAMGSLTASVPTITGSATVASTLTAVPGAWGPAPVTLAYQWYRSGTAISAATAATYTPVAGDLGGTITVKVTGSRPGYTTVSQTSAGSVVYGTLVAPVPTITGEAKVGSTLTAVAGAWGPAPVTLAYQWYRAGTAISGATSATYTSTADDLGASIVVKVTGSKTAYTTTSTTSAGTASVAMGTLTSSTPTIAGGAKVGSILTAVPGAWGPAPVTHSYQWYRSGAAISGATGATYTPGASELGRTITVKVTGSKVGYNTASQTSPGSVIYGTLTAPAPTITGESKVGAVLTAVPGAWGPAPVTLTYQWYRSGTAISGATAATYKVRSGDEAKSVSVKVTGTKPDYTTTSKTSAGTASIAKGTLTTSVPTITGTAKVGSILTAVPGAWGPAPVTLAYQWYRSGIAISGATAATYTPGASEVGRTITVKITGSKLGYTTSSQTSIGTKVAL